MGYKYYKLATINMGTSKDLIKRFALWQDPQKYGIYYGGAEGVLVLEDTIVIDLSAHPDIELTHEEAMAITDVDAMVEKLNG